MANSLEKWQSITQDPRVVSFFSNLFETVGIRIIDTKEEFTCIHRGDRIDFVPGIDEKKTDYVVELQSYQVDRLAQHANKGELGLAEQYRIIRALFSPATAATLKNPILSNSEIRYFSAIEDLIHVFLKSPAPKEPDCEDASHTLIYVNAQWLVVPGIHGNPRRIFSLSLDDALFYHRKVFSAMKTNSWLEWYRFWRWYLQWRKTTSTKPEIYQ